MKKHQTGFTLIELVTVIILIGILAVNVVPKFSGSSSFEAHPYRVQLMAALRLTQQRAMQQTNGVLCHQVILESTRIGVPDRTNCAITTFPNNWQPDANGVVVESGHTVTFSLVGKALPNILGFDNMGRPLNDCSGGCILTVTSAVESVQIKIESEGFIHAI